MINNKLSLFFQLANWLNRTVRINHRDISSRWEADVNKWVQTRGIVDTCKRIKAIRLHVEKMLLNDPLFKPAYPSLSINKKTGIPKCIGYFTPLLTKENTNEVRYCLTLLRVSRILDFRGPVDLSPITAPSEAKPNFMSEIKGLVSHVMMMEQLSLPRPTWTKHHLTTKAGPNSLAMIGSIVDANLLPEALLQDLKVLGGDKLIQTINLVTTGIDLEKWIDKFDIKRKLIRKLSIVHDKEGKERIIAILDYWSQTALKPLHDKIFAMLGSLSQDMTFNQLGSLDSLPTVGVRYSLDLKQATDRFPLEFQKEVVKCLVGSGEYADSWARVMTDFEFYVPWEDTFVKYGCGQPMGAYSSWAVFNLSHHILIKCIALKLGKPFFKDYIVLGDDVVIQDDLIAKEYLLTMNNLGVEISEMKSFTSDVGYEFAKRVYRHGEEITGFPIEALLDIKKWFLIANELRSGFSRWSIPVEQVNPRHIVHLLNITLTRGSGFSQRLTKKVCSFWNLPLQGDSPETIERKLITLLPKGLKTTLSCNHLRNPSLLSKIVMEFLADTKAKILEDGLYKSSESMRKAKQSFKDLLRTYKGGDAQSILMALPPVAVGIEHCTDVQGKIDMLRSNAAISAEDIVFSKADLLRVDPNRLLMTRAHELILCSNATLLNRFNMWGGEYGDIYHKIVADNTNTTEDLRAMAKKVLSQRLISPVMEGFPLF